ncbi:PREDICTED: ethanolamine kinase-like, partial [Priapulus caudatus]|uniref:ethanolamine kinase n=1 Tax=Priapulus caudatus TaxID=37621 RepID=A0ABM1F697_PRICU
IQKARTKHRDSANGSRSVGGHHLVDLDSPVVFCPQRPSLKQLYTTRLKTFIDYEYGDFNYQAFDIGLHFAEYVGVDAIDYSRYPDRTFQEKWLRVYLRSWYSEMGKNPDSITDQHVADLYEKVNKFAMGAHIYAALWAFIQAYHSKIDFDYLDYGIIRLTEYFRMKAKYLH